MSIIAEIEKKYRESPKHGVTFSIDANAYECDCDIIFSAPSQSLSGGVFFNWQDIILDGKVVGYLEETQSGRLFDPMCVSFCRCLADCEDYKLWEEMEEKYQGNPHLVDEGESLQLRFATLNQFINHIRSIKNIW